MKLIRYLAVLLVVIAIVGAILNHKRETIARNIANSALRGQGLVATDLSIDTLATDHIVLSRLVLVQDDGARYELKGLTFPLSFPSFKAERITIDELHMVPAESDGKPVAFANILRTFLQLPQTVPNTTVLIGKFSGGELPTVRDINWRASSDDQRLALSLNAYEIKVDIAPEGADQHRATIVTGSGNDPEALNLSLAIVRRNAGYTINANASVHLLPWLPLLHSLELMPTAITALDATLEGPVSINIGDDSALPITASGDFSLTGERVASFQYGIDDAISVRLTEPAVLRFGLSYPDFDWTAAVARADLVVNSEFADGATGRLENLACQNGIECVMQINFVDIPLNTGNTTTTKASIAATLTLAIDATTRIDFKPDTTLTVSEIHSGETSVASIAVSRVTGMRIVIDEDHWSADAKHLAVDVRGLLAGSMAMSFPASVDALHVRDDASQVDFGFSIAAGAATVAWKDVGIIAPGVKGTLKLAGDLASTEFALTDAQNALTAQVSARQSLSSKAGSATLQNAAIRFDQRQLSGWLRKWPYVWDVISGSWAASGDAAWSLTNDDLKLSGSLAQKVEGLAGHYNDIAFTGLESTLSTTMGADGTINVEPSTMSIALLDVGIPIEEISAGFTPNLADRQLSVQDLSMAVLGGRIVADPFVYTLQAPSNEIVLHPQSIQLQFMVDLAEFDDIELTGSISGRIPVDISDTNITVTGGRLASDAPGGVISYKAGGAAAINSSEIDLVSRALGNFRFDSLTSDVDYNEAGDLKLKMRLSGINPDMDPRQPVILNLGVENNIPQLLRSLQATRAIEDVLRKKSQN